MRFLWSALAAALVAPGFVARADEPTKAEPKSVLVPYRLTVPKHVLIRAKINGKGPFNFILDTGAPAVFITTKLAEKVGVKARRQGLGELRPL